MSFLHQERHQRRRQQRGPYTTKACTNCQQKHAKCSGEATCKRCTQHNLVCTFNDSGKKRGPKKNGKHPEQVYALNGLENDFDGTSMLSSVIPNHKQGYTSTLPFPSEYLQRQSDNFEFSHYSNFYEDQTIYAPQEISSVYYTDTRYIIDNTYISDNFFLYDNLFFDNN
ncbi:Zn2-C6 fungal-type DNA-binding domain [Gigaspora margarita]|uniref:Zn2-C6 fungal-type DNA-binding domain n=1 Tax=Gigaspora margarita TaxID=4874 RepID=A0A8H4AMA7_GIGMA|nr:Zn2-C6 fungal-type DNA-binding domain [Gigaspora margarita]